MHLNNLIIIALLLPRSPARTIHHWKLKRYDGLKNIPPRCRRFQHQGSQNRNHLRRLPVLHRHGAERRARLSGLDLQMR